MNSFEQRPDPSALAAAAARRNDPAHLSGEVSADELSQTVGSLLDSVDEVREAAGDDFDLAALARQSQLLEQAHDALTSALEDVDL